MLDNRFKNSSVNFDVPSPFIWIVQKGIIGADGKSPLEPWYLLDEANSRLIQEIWPMGPSLIPLVCFAKRQDSDRYACFEINASQVSRIVVIDGWVGSGYTIVSWHSSIWKWLESVINDVEEWHDVNT